MFRRGIFKPELFLILVWLGLALALYFLVFQDATLLDHHGFRQTQTASVARELMRDGPILAYHLPVFGAPWSVPMEFPIYQWLVAKAALAGDGDVVSAGRLVSLAFALLALVSIWWICRLLRLTQRQSLLVLGLTAFSPAMLYWSQSVMIETAALAFALLMTAGYLEAMERGRLRAIPIAVVAAVATGLTKATTFGVFAIALVVYASIRLILSYRQEQSLRPTLHRALKSASLGLLVVGPALVVTKLWIAHADAIKAAHPLTEWLTSSALRNWNYGPMSKLLNNVVYLYSGFRGDGQPIFQHYFGALYLPLTILAAVGTLWGGWKRGVAILGLLVCFLAGPAIFRNLYEHHYYYWMANLCFATAAVALGLDSIASAAARWAQSSTFRKLLANTTLALTALAVLSGQIMALNSTFLVSTRAGSPAVERIAAGIRKNTSEDDVIAVFGADWNPFIHFYSDRRAIMARSPDLALPVIRDELDRVGAAVFCGSSIGSADAMLPSISPGGVSWGPGESFGFCVVYPRLSGQVDDVFNSSFEEF